VLSKHPLSATQRGNGFYIPSDVETTLAFPGIDPTQVQGQYIHTVYPTKMGHIAIPTSTSNSVWASYLTLWGSSIYLKRAGSLVSKHGHVTSHVTKLITGSQTKHQSQPSKDGVNKCKVGDEREARVILLQHFTRMLPEILKSIICLTNFLHSL
jgi:hypothetical protein